MDIIDTQTVIDRLDKILEKRIRTVGFDTPRQKQCKRLMNTSWNLNLTWPLWKMTLNVNTKNGWMELNRGLDSPLSLCYNIF